MTPSVRARPVHKIRLDGGRPCLDFVNTIHDRHARVAEDYIGSAERYWQWSRKAGLISEREARTIALPADPRGLMQDVRVLRTELYAVFTACARREQVPRTAARRLDEWVHRAWRSLRVKPGESRALKWDRTAQDAYLPLKRVALSALELLGQYEPTRLKLCANDTGCGWVFYDQTKNHRRRWCAMETCGTLAKMRTFRARHRFGGR